jgi:hypothetical protein
VVAFVHGLPGYTSLGSQPMRAHEARIVCGLALVDPRRRRAEIDQESRARP